MNPADALLIEQIQHVTQGGSRLLVTLARRGKALERDEPRRAVFLLESVRTHPLYKGGRLAFDMLEIEDLMLDGEPVDTMSTREVIQVLRTGAFNLAETLREMGSPAQGRRVPREMSSHDTDLLGDPGGARLKNAGDPASAAQLPRVSLGPEAREEDRDTRDTEPELRSSDYLYDYVVVGLLDVIGSIGMLPSRPRA